jgi:hypothetical protein
MRRRVRTARRRAARSVPPRPPKSDAALREYANKAREIMRRFDQLPPYQRALINFFGADVCARVCEGRSLRPEEIPAKLGRKAEFDAYYEEVYAGPERERRRAELQRQTSVWDGFLT